ncbi:MAG: crotonase/enoyl-CoA hydratase family protein [Oceanospirillaceae bacterium]|nr:crotonase/enoyl-CoA hydratase family protein [Oceanospirillaceae bacterium]MCP5336080.1 crotonase/enoyl-CoA hydratase family protein [Oceanospirillaceae bacterium]
MELPVIVSMPEEGIALVTLNQPELRNPISDENTVDALVGALNSCNQDDDVRCVVLTGAGSAFSAGGNVRDMIHKTGMFAGDANQVRQQYADVIQRIPLALYQMNKPVIAAVNGPAVGAGCDIAMYCDMRIASDRAFFAESFINVGLIPGDGGAWILPRIIGYARATQMALTGERISAQKALEWGMINELTSEHALLPRAIELASSIAAKSPQAVRATKQLLRQGLQLDLSAMLQLSAAIQSGLHQGPEHIEAVTALLEKRVPVFKGL